MRLDIIRQQRQFLISRAQTKLYRNTSQSVTYVLTTKKHESNSNIFCLQLKILCGRIKTRYKLDITNQQKTKDERSLKNHYEENTKTKPAQPVGRFYRLAYDRFPTLLRDDRFCRHRKRSEGCFGERVQQGQHEGGAHGRFRRLSELVRQHRIRRGRRCPFYKGFR